jgi:hypothetical protein
MYLCARVSSQESEISCICVLGYRFCLILRFSIVFWISVYCMVSIVNATILFKCQLTDNMTRQKPPV